MLQNNPNKLLIEVAGHTHQENLRVDTYSNKGKEFYYRNVLVGTAICPRNGQMPGFNTFKIDK